MPMPTEMTPRRFIAKWSPTELTERAASQEHFIDICRLLGQPTPAERDPAGNEYTFEKGVKVTGPASGGSKGEGGFADVWWRGKFAWEYKRKDKYKDLVEAYRQLCQYREALENPPLLIVSDIRKTEIHTNFTGTRKEVHVIELDHLAHPDNLDKLRRVFEDPHSFKPTLSTFRLTEEAAAQFAKIADQLRQRGHDPPVAAHFLMKCMFCLFAEDVQLLPDELFSKLLDAARSEPDSLTDRLTALFDAMRSGGHFGVENIAHFNGGLFDDAPALSLKAYDINTMRVAGAYDWGAVEPTVFGTLFERSLDPAKRSQIGAHYTSREDIMLIVGPVVMQPLRDEWVATRAECEKLLAKVSRGTKSGKGRKLPKREGARQRESAPRKRIDSLLHGFQHRLATIRILDPACGSGNFLYVAIQELLALEKEVIVYASRPEIASGLFPQVRPTQLHGIEINPFAAELAQVVIWIGYLQWMKENGFAPPRDPILEPLRTIECRDAILDWADEDGGPLAEWQVGAKCLGVPKWPEADFVIGNPPFLGGGYLRRELGDEYVDILFDTHDLPKFSDLCCYWFDGARRTIGVTDGRVGLLATQGIRGGVNRTVLDRAKEEGDIFMAWSDRDWILDGATVHVSLIGFDRGAQQHRTLNGTPVTSIHADLTADIDLTVAKELAENDGIQFEGDKKGAKFEVPLQAARRIVAQPHLSDESIFACCRPWFNGKATNGRDPGNWIVDFGPDCSIEEAAKFESAFGHIASIVKPKYGRQRQRWWIHERARREMREAIFGLPRYLVTVRHAPHRLFVWRNPPALPDSALVCFARADDRCLGVLQSSIHVLWARRIGTQVREKESGDRYVAACFETFAMPWPPGEEPGGSVGSGCGSETLAGASGSDGKPVAGPRGSSRTPAADTQGSGSEVTVQQRIADAARELNEQRERWLNPPEWIEMVARLVDRMDDFADVPEEARGLIRQSAIMAEAARDPHLKTRTLTRLYNQRPTWLRLAHEKLDRAVLAAYAAVDPEGGWEKDWAEVWVETGAGQALAEDHELAERRGEVDQLVLGNLLRMNLARSERGGRG